MARKTISQVETECFDTEHEAKEFLELISTDPDGEGFEVVESKIKRHDKKEKKVVVDSVYVLTIKKKYNDIWEAESNEY